MRDHPIVPVTEPLQYRAIGIVRGTYCPNNSNEFTRGQLTDLNGEKTEAVVLGRAIALIRRHLQIDKPHLWVVYPKCRSLDHLHLQIAGVWEPSTLGNSRIENIDSPSHENSSLDKIPEGDDYFSIRGELIYTKPEEEELIIKIRQQPKNQAKRPLPFKVNLKGVIPIESLHHFVDLDARRIGQQLHVENYDLLDKIQSRPNKKNIRNKPSKRNRVI